MTIYRSSRVVVHPDAASASRAAAQAVVEVLGEAVEHRGRATLALSGGSTPSPMYRHFADTFGDQIPWERVHLLWGDERCVPPGHPRSNFGMAWSAFISRVPIPEKNVHRMRGELPPPEGAAEYRRVLHELFGDGTPRFDLIHLGVGADGHTASLFPFDTKRLFEREDAVTVAFRLDAGEYRLTLTLPVINNSTRIDFLALGRDKAPIVKTILNGPLDPLRIPAQFVNPQNGEIVWTVDAAAAPAQ